MKYSNTIEYNINTKLDSSGLTKLQAQIKQLENSMQQMSNRELLNSDKVQAAKTQLEGLNTALTNSFNSSLGILDLSKFRAELDAGGVSAKGLQSAFNMMGAEGQAALNGLTTQIANFNGGIERTSSAVDKIFTTFSNTFRWGMVSSFFSQFMNAIHNSVDYVKELDDSLTQIMLVTDYNRDSMNQFAKSANEAAKAVSMTTTGMTNASLIFAQQGYDLGQSQELATLSAKLANASQQDTATTSDQITAYMNAYGLENSIAELTQQMDNWALIANVSAADVGELAQASQRAASMANAVGVSGEQLAAQIATIESVTREAPEQIGNGLKTLYARFSDIAAGGEDEDGFGLGKVTSELNKIGVQIFDEMGQIRDVGDIMEDLMVIWDDLDQTSKVAASQALAGKYQVNRFMALMDNSDMYQEYKGVTGSAATGTLDQMSEEYANSIEGRSAKLQASLEGLFSTVFNTDDIYPWMDAAQGAVDLLQQFFDALGGGKTVLLGITALLTQAFSQNMARSINDTLANRQLMQTRQRNIEGVNDTLDRVGIDRNSGIGQYISNTAEQAKQGAINDAQYDTYMSNVQNWINAQTALTQSEEELQDTINALNMAYGKAVGENNAVFKDENGLNTQFANEERLNLNQDQVNKIMSQSDFSEAIAGAHNYSKALQDVQRLQQQYNSEAINSKEQLQQLDLSIDQASIALRQLYNTGVISDDMFESMEAAIQKVRVELEQSGKATDQTEKELDELISAIARFSKTAEGMDANQLKKMLLGGADEVQRKQAARDFNQTQVNRAETDANESKANIDSQQQIKGILDTLNAVQQLTFAWQAFQNLGSLWANEDLSTGEKVLQTIMNLTMAMPQLISALQSIKDTQIFDNIGNMFANLTDIPKTISEIPKAAESASNATMEIQKLLEIENKGTEAYDKMMEVVGEGAEIADSLEDVWRAGEKATETLGSMDQELVELVKNGGAVETKLTGIAKIFADGMATAMTEGATGAGLFAGGLKAIGVAAAEALIPLLPYLAIGAAIAGIAFIIGQEAEKAKKAKEEALEAFDEAQSKLEEMQALQEKVDNFQTNFESKKSKGEGFEGLADEARDLADALKEAGHASEGAEIRLAATKAAALGTEEAYQELANTVKTASLQAEMDTNTDAQRAAMAVLDTQKADLDEIAQKQATLRDLKEQLNDLDQEDSRRGVLENRIKELEEFISKNQEAVEAANQLREAQAANVGLQLSQQTSDTVHSSGIDDATKRAGTYSEYTGTYDYDTLNEIYSKNVADWDKYSELEKIDIMLHTLQDDAQIAAVEIEQILQTNSSIKDMGYAGQSLTADEQRDNITGALENTGLSAEQNLQLMATFDKDATYKEIMDGIAEVQQGLESGEDFNVLLKAKFDPEQIEQGVKEAINAYEPTDEDIDADAFKNMANYIQGADASIFEEGGMLEDVSSEIQNNAEALEDLVEGILRYDDAVSTLNDNEEKWREALSDNADLQDRAEAVTDLKETYSDFLDLGADVSDSFAENTHNLDLMAEAARGDVDAYNELLAAASKDIAVNVYGVDENLDALQRMSDYLQSDAFQDVEVGMAIDDQAFYDALNKMSADANWTAADMEAYLSDIGCSIDPSGFEETANSLIETSDQTGKAEAENLTVTSTTEVSSETGQEANTTEYTSAIADVDTITGTSVLPVTAGNLGTLSGGQQPTPVRIPYSIPSVKYTAVPISKTDIQEKTGYAVNTKAEQGGSGAGGVQVKRGSVKKSDSGGTKNKAASSPKSSGGGGGGGGKKGSCFVAGTLISTSLGFKPIEQIQKEDIVLSYNKLVGLNEYSEVLQTMIHDTTEPIYTLYIKDEQLRVTGIHRFLVVDKITCGIPQWVHAADLKVGQWVLFADGTWHVIHKIEVNIEHQTVYNFEVSHNHNYYVGRNQILAHNKGSSGGSGKSSEPKKIEPKEKKEHKKDYYEEVDNQLDKVEKTLSKIEKQEDRLVGTKARANQNRQLDLLQKEIKLQEKKLDILKNQEQVDVWKALKDKDKEAQDLLRSNGIFSDIPDAQVDEDGIISNYEEISAAIDKAHNELIDKYNAAAAASNEEETKRLDEQIKKFDDLGEAILKNSQRANDIQVEIEDLTNTLEDLKYSIQDIRNEAYKAAVESYEKLVELKEEAAELKGLFRDFDDNSFMNAFSIDDTPYQDLIVSLEKINDIYSVSKEKADAYYDDLIQKQEALKESTTDPAIRKAAESTISFYKEQQALLSDTDPLENGELGRNRRELERLKGWIDNPDAEDNPFKDDEATLRELYDQARENTLESFKKYREEVQNYRNAITDIYDDQEDAIDRQINQFDRLTEKVERISDTYSLYYGEDSYDQLDTFYARQGDIMKNQLDQLNTAYNHWQKQYQEALATGDKKLIQEIQDKMDDAEDAMLDAAQELAELWVKKFENAVEASSQHIYNNLFGSNDISELTDNWELQKDYMERYKDDVEKAYEVDKLRNKYLDLLDEAQGSSAQTQNRIRQQMQEQLDLLQSQTTVSEYDVKLANAKLEILQKQIALEDAQRNKNKMQLRRDTQGNYRYIYTADQGNVREAQQDLEDSEYDAYEMTKQETISNNDRAINLLQDYIQKRAAIWNKYKDDATARGQALAELEAEYEKIFGALAEDFTDTSSGMYDVLNWLIKNGSEDTTTAAIGMLDTLYDKNGEIKDKTGQDWMDLANLIQNQVLPKITEAVTKADLELEDQAVSLKDSMVGPGGALTKIGSGADDIANSMDMAAESTRALASATDDLFTALGADDGKLQTALKKLTEYEEQLRKTQETTSSLATQLRTANEIAAAKTAEANNYKTSLDRLRSGEDIIVNHEIVNAAEYKRQQEEAKRAASGGGGGGGGGGRNHLADARAIWYNGAWGNGGDWYTPYSRLYGRDNANKVLWYFNHGYGVNFDFDTGGYTGEWDKTDGVAEHKHGKLAFLHQKELVLNESDTKNILEAVSMIREMSTITQSALTSIGRTNPVNNISSTYNPLTEQRVDIQASFPNATDAEDIRQALIGLSDQAYQYAHKTI